MEHSAGLSLLSIAWLKEPALYFSADNGEKAQVITTRIGITPPTVYLRLKRFQPEELAALHIMERLGRQPTYNEVEPGTIIATVHTHPVSLTFRLVIGVLTAWLRIFRARIISGFLESD